MTTQQTPTGSGEGWTGPTALRVVTLRFPAALRMARQPNFALQAKYFHENSPSLLIDEMCWPLIYVQSDRDLRTDAFNQRGGDNHRTYVRYTPTQHMSPYIRRVEMNHKIDVFSAQWVVTRYIYNM